MPHRPAGPSPLLRLAALGVALAAGIAACAREDDGAARERTAAAHAGVRWMIGHAGEMPPGWGYANLQRLHRIVTDPGLVAGIEAALRRDAASGRHVEVPGDLASRETLGPAELIPTLFELLRRKELGLPYEREARAIGARIAGDGPAFWGPVWRTQKLVMLYLLEELGVGAGLDYEEVRRSMRELIEVGNREKLAQSISFNYALTHLVLYRSRYFRRPVAPAELGFAVPVLRDALRHLLETGRMLDLQAEILGVLPLVGAPDDALMAAGRNDLLARQREDGSWGEGTGATRSKVHLTFNAISALLVLPERLRPDPAP